MAKVVSLIVKVAVCVIAVTLLVLKGIGKLPNITAEEITIVCGACIAYFLDISVNTALDKFKKDKE